MKPQSKYIRRCWAVLFLFIIGKQHAIGQQYRAEDLSTFYKFADTNSLNAPNLTPYYVALWSGNQPIGLKIFRRLGEQVAIIKPGTQSASDFIKQQISIAPAKDKWKYSPYAENNLERNSSRQLWIILSGENLQHLLATLNHYATQLTILHIDTASHSVLIKTNKAFLSAELLARPEITFIDLRADPHPEISIIGYDRSFHGINAVDYSIPGANGKNIVAGVKEQKMEEADLDLYKRVLPSTISSATVSNHATVISSIIGGAGNSFYDGRGIAYGCKFFPSSFANLFADDPGTLNANKISVQNHSYGTIIQQFYGAEAQSYDMQAWQNKDFVAIFSSGNSGTGSATDGPYKNIPGFANLTGNFKMAKNIITVGAIDNKGNLPLESSAGPTYDGRVAPQLVALGPNGTSDAAAIVTGTVAVMQQVYADSNNQVLPPSELIRAVLYNSAEDIYHTGIDYKTGYGLLNSFAAIKAIQQKEYDGSSVIQGQQWTRTISLPPNIARLKVTLSWTDSAASLNNNKALINDLDLEVIQTSTGTVFKPWVLAIAHSADSLDKLPVRKRDSLNTAEQIDILFPAAGDYHVNVSGSLVINQPLNFNIAWHIDTLNTFHFTNPQHSSDVNINENPVLDIKWKTFVADTNQTGNLFASYDAGINWQLIKSGLKIYTNHYLWTIKDTSSRAQFKMETGFGAFLSKEIVITKVLEFNVDFLCTDSFRLSWNKHVYANSYRVYALTDSPYLKQVTSTVDTFIVLKRLQYPWLVYAIEPTLNNGLPAVRSIAQDINLQGVQCFYKTFYFAVQDQNNVDLILELSSPAYVDSLYFEQVNSSGQLQQVFSGTKTGSNVVYHQLVTGLPSGTSYWRVRIKLKGGGIVYTGTISIITTGKRYILFYPNPVDRNATLTFLLQQNLPTDSKLQLFDISGRLVRSYSEIPNSIEVKTFSAGLIIYKLFSRDSQLLETGKLLIK